MTFSECISRIPGADEASRAECLRRWDAVAKPLHSLGLLETLTARMAAVQRTPVPHAAKKRVLVFCADNGVVAEGVTQSDASVTAAVAAALAGGSSNVNIMARSAGADVVAYDVGMGNVTHLNALIRAQLHCTPTELVRQFRDDGRKGAGPGG